MGNSDKWTTPKQIKIEREGEPKGTRRGPLKRGERRKGKKARKDEILSALNDVKRYLGYIRDDEKRRIEHPEWYIPIEGRYKRYDPEYRKWFKRALDEFEKRLRKAAKDGVVTKEDVENYGARLCVQ